jgi:hypothetical protein
MRSFALPGGSSYTRVREEPGCKRRSAGSALASASPPALPVGSTPVIGAATHGPALPSVRSSSMDISTFASFELIGGRRQRHAASHAWMRLRGESPLAHDLAG